MTAQADIQGVRFSDQQIERFAAAAGLEYAGEESDWRADLDDAARGLVLDELSSAWPTPSAMIKELRRIEKEPTRFIARIEIDDEYRSSPAVVAIVRRAQWLPDRLPSATEMLRALPSIVRAEIEHLDRVVGWRKANGVRGNAGEYHMGVFIERLAWVFNAAYHRDVSVTLPYCGAPTGTFIKFAKSVVGALAENLPDTPQSSRLIVTLRALSLDANTAIWNRLSRSDAYRLAVDFRKAAKAPV